MRPGLEIIAHATGPWLVRAGRDVYAVPAALGGALLRWQGQRPSAAERLTSTPPGHTDPGQWSEFLGLLAASLDGESNGSRAGRLPPPVWLRLPLLPAPAVRFLAHRLSGLASGRGLLLLGLLGSVGYLHLALAIAADPLRPEPGHAFTTLGLFLVTALWHELGHAAALAREGYPPGGIGAGLLFVIPVLFADVTAIGALPRRGRLRVDVGGVAFQFALGGGLAAAGLQFTGGQPLVIAGCLALLAVTWSLFPFIRADGYWLVCDALGLEELETDDGQVRGPRLRRFLTAYRLGNAAFLLAVGVLLPLRYGHPAAAALLRAGLDWSQPVWRMVLLPVGAVALVLVWRNLLRRVVRLVRAAF